MPALIASPLKFQATSDHAAFPVPRVSSPRNMRALSSSIHQLLRPGGWSSSRLLSVLARADGR